MIFELSLVYSDNATISEEYSIFSTLANVHNLAIEYGISPEEVRNFSDTDYHFALMNAEAKNLAQKRLEAREKMKAQAKRGR